MKGKALFEQVKYHMTHFFLAQYTHTHTHRLTNKRTDALVITRYKCWLKRRHTESANTSASVFVWPTG